MKFILLSLLATMLTACAPTVNYLSTPFKTSVELAQQECRKIGYVPNTQQYMSCVERQAINIRNNR
jgi:hypothetical protein